MAVLAVMFSCAIENDIPYPIIEASITAMEVEGQRASAEGQDASAVINKNARTISLYVNDSVDISRLKITRLDITPQNAVLSVDSALCENIEKFPTARFASLDSLPLSANTRVDFTKPVAFTLQTYQDYVWTVTVNQIIDRKVSVDNQIGDAVIDVNNRIVIVYVSEDTDLKHIQIETLNLGGEFGRVKPDPSEIHDFSSSQVFYAARRGEDSFQEWKVYVYHKSSDDGTASSEVFAMSTKATLKGSIQKGKTPVVEYRKQGAGTWKTATDVTVSGTSFKATISGLSAGTTYDYRVSVDGTVGGEQSFTTVRAISLTNGSFEDWSQDGNQWNPWAAGGTSFWGTGNKGTSIIGSNVTTPTDESVSGKAAYLASRAVILKGLAAGNLFTGDFELDGTNGILTLGRDFSSFPTSLNLYCKYTTSKITQVKAPYESLKGEDDMCHIYIALSTDKVTLRTKNGDAFDKKGSSIVAYGEYISNSNVSGSEKNGYKKINIPLEYYYTDRTPKYIIIVCTASRYGDFFTGGEGSKLWLDEMELVYE